MIGEKCEEKALILGGCSVKTEIIFYLVFAEAVGFEMASLGCIGFQ